MRGWVNDRYLLLLFAGLILGVVLVQTCQKSMLNKVFVRMFLRFRIMRYGTGYAIPHFLSRE